MQGLSKYGFVFLIVAIAVTGQNLLKRGLHGFYDSSLLGFITKIHKIVANPDVVGAFICYGSGLLLYLFLLSKYNLTNIYPICSSLTLIGITVSGIVVLNEPAGLLKMIGISLIITGIVCIEIQ